MMYQLRFGCLKNRDIFRIIFYPTPLDFAFGVYVAFTDDIPVHVAIALFGLQIMFDVFGVHYN